MDNPLDREWEAIHGVIAAEKSRAWAQMPPLDLSKDQKRLRSRRIILPLAVAAVLVLAVGMGLFFTVTRRGERLTLDQLPLFTTGSDAVHAEPLSPNERELGERLAGWMVLAGRDPARESFPSGWLLNSDPEVPQEKTDGADRETLLERFLWLPALDQEVES